MYPCVLIIALTTLSLLCYIYCLLHRRVLNICRPKLSNGKTWLALDSQSYDYFCSRGKIASGDTRASIFNYDYLAMPIFGG
ncbi:unnamed protein product, partial [Closterium sp. NIES-54]